MSTKKPIVTICSSMQFKTQIKAAAIQLTQLGFQVLTPDLSEKSASYVQLPQEEQHAAKRHFIAAHFDKIQQADAILVLNYEKKGLPGYIGSNTLMEIGVAFAYRKQIFLLNQPGNQSCAEEVSAVATSVISGNLGLLQRYLTSKS